MKISTLVFIELGILGGIVLAGYTLPGTTPLPVFLTASGICFVAGNIFLARRVKRLKAEKSPVESGPWPHLFRALAIVAVVWPLRFLFFKR